MPGITRSPCFLLPVVFALVLLVPTGVAWIDPVGNTGSWRVPGLSTTAPVSDGGPVAPCHATGAPSTITGTIAVYGGPSPPSPAGWGVVYYAQTYEVETQGAGQTDRCYMSASGPGTSQAETSTTASYSVNYVLPTGPCPSGDTCTFSGPWTPDYPSIVGLPAGYVQYYSSSGINVCYALSSVSSSSGSEAWGTTGGPLTLTASAFDACGNPTLAPSVSYDWGFATMPNGWSFGGGVTATGSTITLDASPNAGTTSVTLQASGSYEGVEETTSVTEITVSAISTSAGTLSASTLENDSGAPVIYGVSNVLAAENYPYTCLLWPTGSGSAVHAPCNVDPIGSGKVSIWAQFNVTYWDNGTTAVAYQPVAEVTNGYSTSPEMTTKSKFTVVPRPTLQVDGLPSDVYAGGTYHPTLQVLGGVPDFAYCWRPANNTTNSCSAPSPSSSFTESVQYASVGVDEVGASVTDSSKIGASWSTYVRVWSDFLVTGAGTTLSAVDLGHNSTLYASVAGGALPMHIWWNSSGTMNLCAATTLASYANSTCTFLPDWQGTENVSITIIDAIGSKYVGVHPMTVNAPPGSLLLQGQVGNVSVGSNGTVNDEVGTRVLLRASFAGGTGQFSYEWLANGVRISSGTGTSRSFNTTWTPSQTGLCNLTFVANDTQGFSTSGHLYVQVATTMAGLQIIPQYNPVDPGASDNFTASFTGGVAPVTFTWSTGDGHTYVTDTPYLLYSWTVSSNYTVRVTATDALGVSQTFVLYVDVVLPLAVPCAPVAAEDPTEVGVPTLFNLSCVTGGTPPYSLDWVFGDGTTYSGGPSAATHSFGAAGNYTTFVKVRDYSGAYVVSGGIGIRVVPHVGLAIPSSGVGSCPAGADRNPTEVGVTETLCGLPQGGVGPYSFSWRLGGTTLSGSNLTFAAPGNYTVWGSIVDHLGANASTQFVIEVLSAPRLTGYSSSARVDANQVVTLGVRAQGGVGNASTWTYRWTLRGTPVGTGASVHFNFSVVNNASTAGNYTFLVQALDLAGGTGWGEVNVTVLVDPSSHLDLQATSISLGDPENGTVVARGGEAPYSFVWSIQTPNGWDNRTTSQPNQTLPSSIEGRYNVTVAVSDSLGYLAPPSSAAYLVVGPLTAQIRTSVQATDNATVAGRNVTISVCVLTGGTGPYRFTIDPNGTVPGTWSAVPSGSSCGEFNTTYATPGTKWVFGGIQDSLGNTFSTLTTILVLSPASSPTLLAASTEVVVHSADFLQANDRNPNSTLNWTLPDPSDVSTGFDPNGTLRIVPWVPGTYSIAVTDQVWYNRTLLQSSLPTNFTFQAVPGPAAGIQVRIPPISVVVGENLSMALTAVDAWGNTVPGYAVSFSLLMNGSVPVNRSQGPFVNYSGVGADVPGPGHVVPVPALAWQGGSIVLNISQYSAGEVYYSFAGLGLPIHAASGASRWNASVLWAPAADHLELSHPETLYLNATENDTDWEISDEYGNPVPGGFVYVNSTWGSYTSSLRSPIFSYGAQTYVAVNYTVEGTGGGEIRVVSSSGVPLASIQVPPIGARTPASTPACSGAISCVAASGWPVLLSLAITLGAAVLLVLLRRRGGDTSGRKDEDERPTGSREPFEDATEEEIAEDARRQAAILDHLRSHGPATMDDLLTGMKDPALTRESLIAYLVWLTNDRRIVTRMGTSPDKPLFSISDSEQARGEAVHRKAEEPAVPVIDETAFEEATLRHRSDEEGVSGPLPTEED